MGNELKLSLENFQSISQGELIFHTGTNVIIGQSNSGKSATFRALKACLINPVGSQRFIKKGTGSSSVTLEYNGNQIVWRRTAKDSSYIINGEVFNKTGRSNAFKILGETGFVVDLNDNILNIEEELQLPFPFGLSKTDLFKLYENVFCISDSAIILKSAKKNEDGTQDEISTLTHDLSKTKNKLEELLEFKQEVNLEKLTKMKEFLKRKQERVNFLNDGLPIIKKAIKVGEFSVETFEVTNLLEPYTENKKLKDTIIQLKSLHSLGQTLKEDSLQVEFKNVLGEYEDLLQLQKLTSNLIKLNTFSVESLQLESKLNEYNNLVAFVDYIKSLKAQIKSKKEKLVQIENRLKELEDALKEFKVCPLCHQPLIEERE